MQHISFSSCSIRPHSKGIYLLAHSDHSSIHRDVFTPWALISSIRIRLSPQLRWAFRPQVPPSITTYFTNRPIDLPVANRILIKRSLEPPLLTAACITLSYPPSSCNSALLDSPLYGPLFSPPPQWLTFILWVCRLPHRVRVPALGHLGYYTTTAYAKNFALNDMKVGKDRGLRTRYQSFPGIILLESSYHA